MGVLFFRVLAHLRAIWSLFRICYIADGTLTYLRRILGLLILLAFLFGSIILNSPVEGIRSEIGAMVLFLG